MIGSFNEFHLHDRWFAGCELHWLWISESLLTILKLKTTISFICCPLSRQLMSNAHWTLMSSIMNSSIERNDEHGHHTVISTTDLVASKLEVSIK